MRKYSETAPDAETLRSIGAAAEALKPLLPDVKVRVELLGRMQLRQLFTSTGSVKAPCYAVITSEDAPLAQANAGFIGEQLAADLTRRGMGTCWSGSLKAAKTGFPLPYVITIGFGFPKDGVLPEIPAERRCRKASGEICLHPPKGKRLARLVEAVRIAPSAMNGQPWRLDPEGSSALHLYREKPSFLTAAGPGRLKIPVPGSLLEKVQEIDCGIALAHILLAAEHFGSEPEFRRMPGKEDAGDKLTYVMSAVLKREKTVR